MGRRTGISWADHTFNPWWGCQKVSPGCKHCYAETLAARWKHDIWGPPATTSRRTFGERHWAEPLRWNEAARQAGRRSFVFSGSMCDVFEDHPDVQDARSRLFDLTAATPHLTWLLLTKRPENINRMLPLDWGTSGSYGNVWLGTSVENQAMARERIPALLDVDGVARYFLSCEPLLEPLDLASLRSKSSGVSVLALLDWVIVGGESGPRHRPMELDWATDIQTQCEYYSTHFFFKQRSGPVPGMLDGVPEELMVQEVPPSSIAIKAVARFVEKLHGERRWDVLTPIVEGRLSLALAYDARNRLDELVGSLADRDIEPFVTQWHAEKQQARKGAASADDYLRQVRLLIPAGVRFPASSFTRAKIDAHLRGLKVQDPTRNRHKAAIQSFAKHLVRADVIATNPVREIEGWGEGRGRLVHYERDVAQRVVWALPQPFQALEALMVGAGLEWQAIARLRVSDVDLLAKTVHAHGGKTPWRRDRLCVICEEWTIPSITVALRDKLPHALAFEGVTEWKALAEHKAACKAVGAAPSTLHDWRHTHAVLLLRAGYKPTTVAHQLGHATTALVWSRYGRYMVDARDYQRESIPPVPPALKENVK